MSDLIQNKMHQVMGDLARPTKFKCMIYPPKEIDLPLQLQNGATNADASSSSKSEQAQYLDYFCHAASFPGLTVQTNEFKYRGRTLHVKSVQEYQQKWTATFYNDEKHALRQMFFKWMLYDQNYQYQDLGGRNFSENLPSISITQIDYALEKDCVVYTLMNVFPTNISEIAIQYDGLNQVETFTAEFTYTHFEINTVAGEGLTSQDINGLIQNTIQNTINSVFGIGKKMLDDLISPVIDEVTESFDDFLG